MQWLFLPDLCPGSVCLALSQPSLPISSAIFLPNPPQIGPCLFLGFELAFQVPLRRTDPLQKGFLSIRRAAEKDACLFPVRLGGTDML